LYNPVPEEEAKHLTDQLEYEWNKELKNNKHSPEKNKAPSLLRALVRIHFWRVFLNSLLLFIEELLAIAQPILTSELLKYFNGEIDFNLAIIYGSSISLSVFIIWLVHHPYSINCQRYGMRLRIACSGLVYRKTLRLTTSTLDSKMSGRMLNLLSNDAARLDQVLLYLPYFIIGPLQVVTVIYLLVKIIDFTFLAGFVIFLMFMPAQAVMAKVRVSFFLLEFVPKGIQRNTRGCKFSA
jgi:ATP-binding cassette, subfamily C (CFTR/MRP), member 4